MDTVEIAAEWLCRGDWVQRRGIEDDIVFSFVHEVVHAEDGVHVNPPSAVYWHDEKVVIWTNGRAA